MKQCSKQLSSSPISSLPNKQKLFSRRQRRRIRKRLRRKQNRMKIPTRSMSMTTQIVADALDMLHISTEMNTKSFEFIERYEITRQHAFKMPPNLRPIVFFIEPKTSRVSSTVTNKLQNSMDEDYYSSYV